MSRSSPASTFLERTGIALRGGGASLSLGVACLAAYLWAVHSFDAPLAVPAMVVAVLASLTAPGGLRLPLPLIIFLVWLAWCAIGITVTAYPGTVTDTVWEYAKVGVLLFVVTNICRTPNQVVLAAAIWLALFILYPMRGTYLNFLFGHSFVGRYSWNRTFGQPNDLAAFTLLAIGLSLFLLQLRTGMRAVRLAMFGTLGGLALLVILTQSRGGFLALSVASLTYLAASKKRFQYLAGALVVAAVVAAVAPESVWSRFRGIRDLSPSDQLGQVDASADQRYTIQLVALSMVKDHPLYGVGVGAYSLEHEIDATERREWLAARGPRDTHNMYLNLAAETGLPGLALFVAMLATTIASALRAERQMRPAWPHGAEALRSLRFGLIAYLLAAVLGTFHRSSFLFVYLGLLSAATTALPGLVSTRASSTFPALAPVSRRRWAASFTRRFRSPSITPSGVATSAVGPVPGTNRTVRFARQLRVTRRSVRVR